MANPIIIPCYASAAARDADYTDPFPGAVVSRTDLKTLEIYDGNLQVWNDLTFESEFSGVTTDITALQNRVSVLEQQVSDLQLAVDNAQTMANNAMAAVNSIVARLP